LEKEDWLGRGRGRRRRIPRSTNAYIKLNVAGHVNSELTAGIMRHNKSLITIGSANNLSNFTSIEDTTPTAML
jgi:hypothetical protein